MSESILDMLNDDLRSLPLQSGGCSWESGVKENESGRTGTPKRERAHSDERDAAVLETRPKSPRSEAATTTVALKSGGEVSSGIVAASDHGSGQDTKSSESVARGRGEKTYFAGHGAGKSRCVGEFLFRKN